MVDPVYAMIAMVTVPSSFVQNSTVDIIQFWAVYNRRFCIASACSDTARTLLCVASSVKQSRSSQTFSHPCMPVLKKKLTRSPVRFQPTRYNRPTVPYVYPTNAMIAIRLQHLPISLTIFSIGSRNTLIFARAKKR